MWLRTVVCAAALLTVACGQNGQKTTAAVETPMPSPTPPVDPHPTPAPIVSKRTGRLSLLQLRRSFPVVMGNDADGAPISWNSGTTSSPRLGFDAYAGTLGEADFINRTEDDLDASPIYVKFMDDAARSACEQAIEADLDQPDQSKRTLMRHVAEKDTPQTNAEGFRKNLAYLKLRFHGIKITDETALEPLETLFVAASAGASNPTVEGWRAICVALLTAPEFHLY